MTSPRNIAAGHTRTTFLGFALAALFATNVATAQEGVASDPAPEKKYSEQAQEMSDSAKEAIEQFSKMIGTMLESFEKWIDDMPRYEAPEVLANGDIIIRRIQEDPDESAEDPMVEDAGPADAPETDATDL